MQNYIDTQQHLDSAIHIASQAKSLDGIKFMVVKHFCGHKNLDKVAKNGLLLTKPNGKMEEVCVYSILKIYLINSSDLHIQRERNQTE